MRRILLSVLCFLLLPLATAQADIYRWQDQEGNWHFADSPSKVPQRYKDQVKREVLPERSEKAPSPVPGPALKGKTDRKEKPEEKAEASGETSGPKTYKIDYAERGNSLTLDVTLNGSDTFPFVVDTGASFISLSREVAEAIGYSPDDILPRIFMSTANGMTTGRLVRLASVQVGDACVHDVVAVVHGEDALGVPGLLGLSFLNEWDWSSDTMNGVLTLTEFTNSPKDDVYGGHNEKWWRKKFDAAKKDVKTVKAQIQAINDRRLNVLSQKQGREELVKILEANLDFYREELTILDRKANRCMVPRWWR